jgi:hypothetical protein
MLHILMQEGLAGAAFWTGSPYVAEHRHVRERRTPIAAEAAPTFIMPAVYQLNLGGL